jgi:hypothetical protein
VFRYRWSLNQYKAVPKRKKEARRRVTYIDKVTVVVKFKWVPTYQNLKNNKHWMNALQSLGNNFASPLTVASPRLQRGTFSISQGSYNTYTACIMIGKSKGPVFSVPPILTPGITCRSKPCQFYSIQYVLEGR